MNGVNSFGHSVTLRTSLEPYFLLKLGRTIEDDERYWTSREIKQFVEECVTHKWKAVPLWRQEEEGSQKLGERYDKKSCYVFFN